MEDKPKIADMLSLPFYKRERAHDYTIEKLKEKRNIALGVGRASLAVTSFLLYTPSIQINFLKQIVGIIPDGLRLSLSVVSFVSLVVGYVVSGNFTRKIKNEIKQGEENVI